MTLRTERDVIETLAGKSVTLDELYRACEQAGVTGRNGGDASIPTHGSDRVWRRRVRNALQTMKRSGRAQRVGEATWVIDGTADAPRRMLLVICGEPSHIELVLSDCERLLAETDEPVDLILADPPWGIGIDGTASASMDRRYARDASAMVGGYVDVDPAEWAEFCERWIGAAAKVLRPGAYLCAVTGPGQAARAQISAEDAGLTFVNQVVIRRRLVWPTSRQFATAHTVATILCAGPVSSPARVFSVPPELPKANNGADYPLDWWEPRTHDRAGLARYPTMLSPQVCRQLVQALTAGPENGADPWSSLVVDPFLGGGGTAVACYTERRRFRGGDVNPRALAFTAARLLDEHVIPDQLQPRLALFG